MRISWYGQSAFLIQGEHTVLIDPFGVMEGLEERGMQFDYPPIEGVSADQLLVTHEHRDHNGVGVVGGSPHIIRSTAGTFESPIGQIRAIASEHDDVAGTQRGPNTIFCFTLDGLRLCHFGDFGQTRLRAEQRAAIAEIDVLFLPVGGGPQRSAVSPQRQSCANCTRDSSCRCTTEPTPSTSSNHPTRSSKQSPHPSSDRTSARSRSSDCSATPTLHRSSSPPRRSEPDPPQLESLLPCSTVSRPVRPRLLRAPSSSSSAVSSSWRTAA